MKKRLLISSVLMSAVLACALGTGTYAWYSASSTSGTLAAATNSGNISASLKGTYAAGTTNLVVTYSGQENVALSEDETGKSYVWYDDRAVEATNSASLKRCDDIIVSWDWEDDTSDDVKGSVVGKTYKITVTASGTNASRIRLHTTQAKAYENESEEISTTFTVDPSTYDFSTSNLTFWYSVEGLNSLETSDVEVQVTATISEVAQQ